MLVGTQFFTNTQHEFNQRTGASGSSATGKTGPTGPTGPLYNTGRYPIVRVQYTSDDIFTPQYPPFISLLDYHQCFVINTYVVYEQTDGGIH